MHCNRCYLDTKTTDTEVICPKCTEKGIPTVVGCFCSKECFAMEYKNHKELHTEEFNGDVIDNWNNIIQGRIAARACAADVIDMERLNAILENYPTIRDITNSLNDVSKWDSNMTFKSYAWLVLAAEGFPDVLRRLERDAIENTELFHTNVADFVRITQPGKPLFTV